MSTVVKLRAPSNGQIRDVTAVSVAEVKQSVASVMNKAVQEGMVAVTKRGAVSAVVLDVQTYNDLVARAGDPLAKLSDRYDEMMAFMQTDAQRAGVATLFGPLPAQPKSRMAR
ncbi:type II toxin-antitoxin system prevent-host-death family antitoxin [Solimonas sp. K1W22B-7]|uniref:type II toxin-antitoxin system prevent-host-death family antitoxin n=1 Tax=Solimonas sp. K1W22B-7 TaxID=2303331 RepID=UPI0013C44EB2|nr:type II toxin-antitoxin system prevent-host-death family antitoxin [Solimonas sp. K1W22B-7]